jgi:hypothetical protein
VAVLLPCPVRCEELESGSFTCCVATSTLRGTTSEQRMMWISEWNGTTTGHAATPFPIAHGRWSCRLSSQTNSRQFDSRSTSNRARAAHLRRGTSDARDITSKGSNTLKTSRSRNPGHFSRVVQFRTRLIGGGLAKAVEDTLNRKRSPRAVVRTAKPPTLTRMPSTTRCDRRHEPARLRPLYRNAANRSAGGGQGLPAIASGEVAFG